MIRIGILGNIGSGKSYVAKKFGYPVFDADYEVSKLYKKNKKIFIKLKNKLPKQISSFPIDKKEITNAILSNKFNIKKNKNKKVVILDIPLLLENKINNKNDILVFVDSNKAEVEKRLKKRLNFNHKLIKRFRKIQFSASYKKRKSNFIIKNNFKKKSLNTCIKKVLDKIL